MEGFTYNGIHSSKFNCWYIPNADDRWFASPEFELYEKEVPGHPGGYSYGDRTKIRTFSLKVFFEDIDRQTRENIRRWLDQKTMGELEFDERPFVVYRCVRPKKTVLGKIYTGQYGDSQEFYSGTFIVEFSCYEPYGYLKYKAYDTYDNDGAGMYCGMLEQSEMPVAPAVTDRSFLIYNPGTEVCDTLIRIGGTTGAGGLTIKNLTNETQCKLSSLPQNGYLEIGSGAGSVIHVNGNTRTLDFQYHDSGYLTQEPYGWNADDLAVTTTAGNTSATVENGDMDCADLVGKYLRVNSAWVKIVSSNENTITLASAASRTETLLTKAVSMNEIEITGTNISLSQLSINYVPMIK